MKIKRLVKDSRGFTLTELLVVIVIIGILVSLAIPKFLNTTSKAKMTEAKLMLKEVYNLQRAYYLENDLYSTSLEEIGFEQEKLKTEGGKARYKIELVESENGNFKALATAVVDFDNDGEFNVWSIDQDNNLKQEAAD